MTAKIERFEDLVAWQKARALAADIYRLTNKRPFSQDFGLRDQIRRAAVSVPSNIAEGFDRWGRAEFQHFLAIAKASCAELRTQLYIAHDVGYVDEETLKELHARAEEVSRIVARLRSSLTTKRSSTQDSALRTQD
jgi:four helix bundle protein